MRVRIGNTYWNTYTAYLNATPLQAIRDDLQKRPYLVQKIYNIAARQFEKGGQVNKSTNSYQTANKAIRVLASCDRSDVFGKSINEWSILHFAFNSKQEQLILDLLDNPYVDPNQRNKRTNTPLHLAVQYGMAEVVEKLLTVKKANPNALNTFKDTPLDLVNWSHSKPTIERIIRALVTHGARIDHTISSRGCTLLHHLVREPAYNSLTIEVLKTSPSALKALFEEYNGNYTPIDNLISYQIAFYPAFEAMAAVVSTHPESTKHLHEQLYECPPSSLPESL